MPYFYKTVYLQWGRVFFVWALYLYHNESRVILSRMSIYNERGLTMSGLKWDQVRRPEPVMMADSGCDGYTLLEAWYWPVTKSSSSSSSSSSLSLYCSIYGLFLEYGIHTLAIWHNNKSFLYIIIYSTVDGKSIFLLIIFTERHAHQMKKIPQKYGGSDKQLTITADNDFY